MLVSYFTKPGNELCTDKTTIDNLEECKVATRNLGMTFGMTLSSQSMPKGCYAIAKGYWNTHASGSKNPKGYPICKIGE